MDELLANPAFQSGIAPFIVALVLGFLTRPLGWYWTGLIVLAGFYVSVYLAGQLSFTPLSSTRKILLLGLAAGVVGLLFDLYPGNRRYIPGLLFVLAAAAALWIAWPLLGRWEGMDFWLLLIGGAVYGGWSVAALEGLRDRNMRAASAALALGLGTGVCAILGASALLGQFGLGLGAAAGAFWLHAVVGRQPRAGTTLLVPVGVLGGLIGLAGCLYAKLPWHVLLILALIPLLARAPLPPQSPQWVQGLLSVAVCGAAAVAAVAVTWRETGAPAI